jgi:hypothetical protein
VRTLENLHGTARASVLSDALLTVYCVLRDVPDEAFGGDTPGGSATPTLGAHDRPGGRQHPDGAVRRKMARLAIVNRLGRGMQLWPFCCPYSPKCVEGEFSEVRIVPVQHLWASRHRTGAMRTLCVRSRRESKGYSFISASANR